MATESGFSSQKKIGEAQYKTIHNLGSDRFGTSVSTKALAEISSVPIAITNVLAEDGFLYLEIPAHGTREEDVIRMISGALAAYEYEVLEVIDPNAVKVINIGEPLVGDTIKPMRWVTSKADAEGNLNFSPGPSQFIKNGVTSVVTEDADPANNKAMPSQLMIYKDGVQYPVAKSTADASETVAVPVEIVGVDGTTINITAGDINVQLTDQGANADVVRLGDGTNQLGINADKEALVHDADVLVEVSEINAKTPDLVGGKVPVDIGLTQGLTNAELRAAPVQIQGAVTGPLTDAELRATALPVSGPLTDAQLRATALPVSGPLTNTQLRAAAVDIISNQLPTTLGQKTAAQSVSVVLATGTTMEVSLTGNATEAKQDTQISGLSSIDGKIGTSNSSLASIDGKLTGVATAANQATTNSELAAIKTAVSAKLTPSYAEVLTIGTSATIILAPANAKWCKIMADGENAGNLRFKMGGAIASSTSGMKLEPGRSEDFQAVGDISICAESGSGNKVYIHFGA